MIDLGSQQEPGPVMYRWEMDWSRGIKAMLFDLLRRLLDVLSRYRFYDADQSSRYL